MRVIEARGSGALVELSREEVLLIAACASETLEAVEEWEFSSRTGAERSDARRLHEDAISVLAQWPEQG